MCLMAIQHLVFDVISSGTGTDTFFIIMINLNTASNVALLNNNGTSAYETGTNNPYEYFHGLGIDLQDFSIRFLRKPNSNGSTVTGVFNICGIYFTAGARNFSDLLADIIRKYREKQAYHHDCQKRKRERYCRNWIKRHLDATDIPHYILQ